MNDVPEIVQAWVRQLLDPEFMRLIDGAGARQIDVRLSASRGKIRENPMIVLNGGPQTMVES